MEKIENRDFHNAEGRREGQSDTATAKFIFTDSFQSKLNIFCTDSVYSATAATVSLPFQRVHTIKETQLLQPQQQAHKQPSGQSGARNINASAFGDQPKNNFNPPSVVFAMGVMQHTISQVCQVFSRTFSLLELPTD